MLRSTGRHTRYAIAAALLLFPLTRAGADGPAPEEKPAATAMDAANDARVNLFLNGPEALDALLKSLKPPDFVLLKGDEFRKLLDRAGGETGARELGPVVDSVAVEGNIRSDRADFSIEYGITLRSQAPTRVPIRLDEQTVTGAHEGEQELPLFGATGGGWQIELRGAGVHRVRVDLKVPLRATVDGHRIDLAIPEAAATRFAWEIADRVSEAATGSGELVEVEPVASAGPGSARTRLSAHLTPRTRLDVSWRVEAEPGAQLAPLLTMQGEIEIDVDPGSIRTRSTWAVHSIRGTTRSLELRLDPADEVLELELDGQPVPAGIERVDGATLLTIVLNDPLRPGLPKSLVMTTRRPIATAASAVMSFNGFTLTNAKEQSGAIGIAQRGNLWVGGTPGRGVRQIDPRTELPPDLRARPATALAYVFVDQPFELGLRVEPSPPLVRTEARTTVMVDARQARVETWLNYQPAHGRLFELAISLPEGLELESVGPKEVVEASQRDTAAAAGTTAARGLTATGGGARVVTVRLTQQAQEGGEFTIQLTGRQVLDPSRPVELALFQPLDATSGGGRIAVLTGRNLTVEVRDDAVAFRPATQEPPADWPWPADRTASSPPALWLRQDGSPAALPLEIAVHPRERSSRTSLRVQVERRSFVIEQETECTVHFGTLDHVDVEVPSVLGGHWETEGGEVARRTELGMTPAGDLLVRLVLAKEVRDKVRLRFRIRRPLSPRLEPDRPIALEVPWIRPVEGKVLPMQIRVASEPGIDLEPRGAGWSRTADEEAPAPGESGHPVRFILASDAPESAPLSLAATAHPLAVLPPLVVSRLWLRTVQGPEYDLRTTAVYLVETHESSFAVALPTGAEWVRAKVGGTTVGQVEQLPKSAGYRVGFPDQIGAGPVVVELEFTLAASHVAGTWSSTWHAPRLIDGGLVRQTLWEVRVPWGLAVVGVPPGWTDENTWVWAGFFFRRRPWQSGAELAAWASGSSTESPVVEGLDDAATGDFQTFLFGRPGQPSDLRIQIGSRGWLVGICSGSVLVVGGLLILFQRPSPRLAWGAALALGLACATIVQPSVTFLAAQSAVIGVALTLLTALMQRLVHRRRPGPVFGESGAATGALPSGSSLNRVVGVGSDDSTAIRSRPISSTVDHHATGIPLTPDRDSATGRRPRAE